MCLMENKKVWLKKATILYECVTTKTGNAVMSDDYDSSFQLSRVFPVFTMLSLDELRQVNSGLTTHEGSIVAILKGHRKVIEFSTTRNSKIT
ncbi:MAG: hypothetical protein M2R45_01504 [Verrucomicrobia subdivision 3 bacterium]|nr:hypothetical protein [Limisphaerales bacterium]MCS1413367.1 hypothetical protein [Limisphaerales bacterium]